MGRIPFLGLMYFKTMAAAATAFKAFLYFLADTNEISIRRVEARRATIAMVNICFLELDILDTKVWFETDEDLKDETIERTERNLNVDDEIQWEATLSISSLLYCGT